MAVNDPRRPTLRNVAERADTSIKTASRVVNGEAGVRPELVARVEEAIRFLDYRPDVRARQLRSGKSTTGSIGFVMVDVANPFFSAILRGIEEVAENHDSIVLAGSSDGRPERQDRLVRAFVARRVDGLIVVAPSLEGRVIHSEFLRGTPLVFLDLEPSDAEVDLVRSDHRAGAAEAVRHLVRHGHQEIAFFGDDLELFSAEQRHLGYLDALREAGLPARPDRVLTGSRSPEEWRKEVRRYFDAHADDPPTAILTAQNFVSVGAVRALAELGLRHRIAHVGFDDLELAETLDPGLTVVPQDPRRLGVLAAERLFERIGGAPAAGVHHVLPTAVVARGSGEIPPPTS